MENKKNVVIAVTGGIAAYKTADLVSRLVKRDINVDVIMTKSATKFISPLTFQSLCHNKVIVDLFDDPIYWEIEHISLAEKADLFAIVPATANIIGKIANGIADDMVTTTVMATKSITLIAPAMNTNMYLNKITQKNMNKLKELGYIFVEPTEGRLACGTYGKGKLADIETIERNILDILFENTKKDFIGKKALVTAGPTLEPLDPIRFITNHSSGKMGYELAKALKRRGADVLLVSGPTKIEPPSDMKYIKVKTALDMYNAVMKNLNDVDIVIGAAAVADYRPMDIQKNKIKKSSDELILKLKRNPDILYEIGKNKGKKILVGFAAETENLIEFSKEKITKKNLDLIVANDVTLDGAGFYEDTNIIKIIDKQFNIKEYPIMMKNKVADKILDEIANII